MFLAVMGLTRGKRRHIFDYKSILFKKLVILSSVDRWVKCNVWWINSPTEASVTGLEVMV